MTKTFALKTCFTWMISSASKTNLPGQPDLGTAFNIYLPRHTPIDDAPEIRPSGEPAPGGAETILLVEDEPAILTMTRMMLERKGYTVLTACTSGEAMTVAKDHEGDIHLLMTDIIMPEMNGRDLATNLLILYPNIKLLFMSGYTANIIADQGVLDADVNFIQKPFSSADLAVRLRAVLDETGNV
ncbi:MAG: response regulator [Desulfatirhabdiaceae bacterium]